MNIPALSHCRIDLDALVCPCGNFSSLARCRGNKRSETFHRDLSPVAIQVPLGVLIAVQVARGVSFQALP